MPGSGANTDRAWSQRTSYVVMAVAACALFVSFCVLRAADMPHNGFMPATQTWSRCLQPEAVNNSSGHQRAENELAVRRTMLVGRSVQTPRTVQLKLHLLSGVASWH